MCFIIPIITAIIGAILGWLLRHLTCNCDEDQRKIEKLQAENIELKGDLDKCLLYKSQHETSGSDNSAELDALKAKNSSLQAELDAALAANTSDDLSAEIAALKSKNSSLETDLAACLASKSSGVDTGLGFAAGAATSAVASGPELSFDAAAAKLVFGKKIKADDLKLVEGIGPKIEELFNQNGVHTWYQLSTTSVDRCKEILRSGGKRFDLHNPTTWPQQANLAFEGKWEELNALQDRLDGGIDRG